MVIIIVIAIILFLNSIPVSECQSPCPGFFRYLVHNRTREIFGRIEIPHPPRNIALHLRVSLSVATILPTKYVGKIELARSRKESVEAIDNGESLFYNIYFPLQRPVPLLTEILFNGHQYCIGHKAYGPIVTNMFLEHILYPPGINPSTNTETNVNNGSNQDKLEIFLISNYENDPIIVKPSSPSPTPQPPPPSQSFDVVQFDSIKGIKDCGKSENGINPLTSGARTSPGQWPWMAAIFASRKDLEFLCAGTLITDRHVITAARCKISEIPSSVLLISLGRYRLDDWHERRGITRQVEEFRIHPEFINKRSAQSDLAILVLRESVPINLKIKPICLVREPIGLENILGTTGYVVGWGNDKNGQKHLGGPRLAKKHIVSEENCLTSDLFEQFNPDKMFCTINGGRSGSCNADNGSGLMLYDQADDTYYLRGIVSLSLLDSDTQPCDLKHYSVYVDVAKFLTWIYAQIS